MIMETVSLALEQAHESIRKNGSDFDLDLVEDALDLARAAEIVMLSGPDSQMGMVIDLFETIHKNMTENKSSFGLSNAAYKLATATEILYKYKEEGNKEDIIQAAMNEVFESIDSDCLVRIVYTDTRYDVSGLPVLSVWMIFKDSTPHAEISGLTFSVPVKKLIESKLAGKMINLPVFILAATESESVKVLGDKK